MNWIFIALLSGNLVTSQHATEEACLGRKAMVEKDQKVSGKCVDMSPQYVTSSTGTILLGVAH